MTPPTVMPIAVFWLTFKQMPFSAFTARSARSSCCESTSREDMAWRLCLLPRRGQESDKDNRVHVHTGSVVQQYCALQDITCTSIQSLT